MNERKWIEKKRTAHLTGMFCIFIAMVLFGIAPWLTNFSIGVKIGMFAIYLIIFSVLINTPYFSDTGRKKL